MNVIGAMARATLIHSCSNVLAPACAASKARVVFPMVSAAGMMVNTGGAPARKPPGSMTSARLYVRTGYVYDQVAWVFLHLDGDRPRVMFGENTADEYTKQTAEQLRTGVQVTSCDRTDASSLWCCGENASCCAQDTVLRQTIAAFLGQPISTSSSSSPASSTAPPTSTSSNPPATSSGTTENQDTGSGGLATGAKIGLGVGIPVAVIALLGAAFVFYRSRKGKKERQVMPGELQAQSPPPQYHMQGYKRTADAPPMSEAPGVTHEMPDTSRAPRAELSQ
jgi:hypothetical protein